MVWGGGFLGELGVLDYAGGTGVGNREALRGEFLPQSLGKSSQNAPSKLQDGRQNKIERRSVAPVGAYTQNPDANDVPPPPSPSPSAPEASGNVVEMEDEEEWEWETISNYYKV
jgi:hypothetical protein